MSGLQRICPHCQEVNLPTALRCTKCGKWLVEQVRGRPK